ncbi:MAG: RidA family protein [Chloroflexi bacterium]|nr:RidA family protein [Chloroflexota bacterium]
MPRRNISSGRSYERLHGYCRAVAVGNTCYVAGTTSLNEKGEVEAPGDMYAQAIAAWRTVERALREAGFSLADVVQTHAYVTDVSRAAEAGRAHGEVFRDIRPVSTLVEVKALVRPEMLVEVEAVAVRES